MTDTGSTLHRSIGDRYVVERELGRGGMATVYLARDLKHDRSVALKVLLPDLAAALGPQRFLREIKLAARLQHPHILSVHDSGDAAGRLWFTMPFVEGESLRQRLKREGQLPLADAVEIIREVAQALDYAHEHGVVHRDIKPENILLTQDGLVLVSDFGVARAVGGDEQLTGVGVSVGTPAYMSPEQASGEPTIDGRSDVYSLGCVAYEMLTGEPPFTGLTAQAIIAKRFSTAAARVGILRPDVPPHIEHAIAAALARTPAGRFPSAGKFAQALKAPETHIKTDTRRVARFTAVAIGLLLAAALARNLLDRRSVSRLGSSGSPDHPDSLTRLAVLPFENLGDTADAYFADGVSDEVRGKLAALSGLEVIARTSTTQYRGTTKPAQQIGKELGAEYLLTGTVRWEKGPGSSRVRVSPELVDARTGAAKWQAPFDAAITDVFQVQGNIASRVAAALHLELGRDEKEALAARPTSNIQAYDAYLRGEAATRRFTTTDPAALRRGILYYEQAVKLDPRFALVWSRISRAHTYLYYTSSSSPVDSAAAEQGARRALALEPRLADARLAQGEYYLRVAIDPARALAEYRNGLAIAPREPSLLGASAEPLQALGRWEESASAAADAFRLDPRSSRAAVRVARALIFLRRYPEALAAVDAGIKSNPASPDAVWIKMMAYIAQGDLNGAHAVYRNASTELDRVALVAYVAHFWEMAWTLERPDLDLLASLSPEPFAGERTDWGLAQTQAWAAKGDSARARMYADTARLAFQGTASQNNRNQDGALLGLSLAYLRRYDDAVAAAKEALELPGSKVNRYAAQYSRFQLARIYAMAGRREETIETLDSLLKVPSYLSPGWLKVDPTFAWLRGDPGFQRLTASSH